MPTLVVGMWEVQASHNHDHASVAMAPEFLTFRKRNYLVYDGLHQGLVRGYGFCAKREARGIRDHPFRAIGFHLLGGMSICEIKLYH
jgi:hypothetical protein